MLHFVLFLIFGTVGVAGGIMSGPDIDALKAHGVAEVFTPGSPLPTITGWLETTLDRREHDRRGAGSAP